MENLIVERIENNKNLFTEKEMLQMKNNYNIIIKVYLLGLLDKQYFDNDLTTNNIKNIVKKDNTD